MRVQEVEGKAVAFAEITKTAAERKRNGVRSRRAETDRHLVLDARRPVVFLIHLGPVELFPGQKVGELVRPPVAGGDEALHHGMLSELPCRQRRNAVEPTDEHAKRTAPGMCFVVGHALRSYHPGDSFDHPARVGVQIGLCVGIPKECQDAAEVPIS
jgi:hypothetical protein